MSMSVVGVRDADSLKSSVPKRGWAGVMGRRNCTAAEVDFEADWPPAREKGGEIRRAPRRMRRPGAVLPAFVGSGEVVTEGVEWLSSLTDRILDAVLDNAPSSPPNANSSCSGIMSSVS